MKKMPGFVRFTALLPLLAAYLASPLAAAVWHVDAAADPAGANGLAWESAFPFLQDALAAASPGDQIRVATGVYRPDEGTGRTDDDPGETFLVPNGVGISGGYESRKANPARDPLQLPSILTGDIDKNDDNPDGNHIAESPADQNGTNSHNVVTINPGTDLITLDGLIITAGANISAAGLPGGGVLVDDAPVEIIRCLFSGNQATGLGGALYFDKQSATIRNCYFTGNTATARGGAVGTLNGNTATFTNCAFLGNLSERGGAVNLDSGSATFTNTTFSGNSGTVNGGAIQANSSAVLTLRNSIIWHNHAAGLRGAAGSSVNLLGGATVTALASNIENNGGTDPQFRQEPNPAAAPASAGDLRLLPISPLQDAGTSDDTTGSDLAGGPRVIGSSIDTGAYERQPTDLHVAPGAPGNHSGINWANAFQSLPDALLAAVGGDNIRIAAGLYVPATVNDSFLLPSGVSLYGGYPPAGAGPRDPLAHPTILSGDVGGDDGVSAGITDTASQQVGNNCHTILMGETVTALTPDNILDGLVFTGGQADFIVIGTGNELNEGGAVFLGSGSPRFRNCHFYGNRAFGGGAVSGRGGAPWFADCTFFGNDTESTLGEGGAARFDDGAPRFERCTFEQNRAFAQASPHGNGAAVYGRLADITFSHCIFQANEAMENGSAFYSDTGGSSTFDNCLLSGNQAGTDGGAIHIQGGVVFVNNVTIAANTGGGIRQTGGASQIANTLVWNNSDHQLLHTGGSLPAVRHSLIFGIPATTTGFTNCLDGTNLANNPLFVDPRDPAAAPTDDGDYRLFPFSPVMSDGENASAPLPNDLDGNNRISGHSVDLGAYEVQLSDSDGDGLSDSFEAAHTTPASTTALEPGSNLDSDPFTALEEFALGLDPNSRDGWSTVYRTDFLPGLGIFLYFTPNIAATHYVRITGEWSYTLEPGSWDVSPIYSGGTFGTLPGEFASRAPNLPTDTRGFVRLRFTP